MARVVEQTLQNTQTLQEALNVIFLTVGNAYYEANKLPNKSQVMPLTPAVHAQIRQSRSTFLDCLDQLEITILRATEVLEKHARQQNVALSNESENGAPAVMTEEKPASPKTMLLTGEELGNSNEQRLVENVLAQEALATSTDSTSEQCAPPAALADDAMAVEPETLAAVDASDAIPPSTGTSLLNNLPDNAPPGPITGINLEDDIMNIEGPIDFGDMDFENFNFDGSAHFDFGSMMED